MKMYAIISMRPRKPNYMESESKSALSDHIEIPIIPQSPSAPDAHQHPHIRRVIITIPSKCIGRPKVTHEILIRFNWSRVSLFLTVIAILMASVMLIVLLLV